MLQTLRNNTQSLVVKIIIGLIIVTFALFGVESLIGLAGQPDPPVSVNGIDIGERQLQNAVDLQRRQLLAQMGQNADPSLLDDALIRKAVINNLVEREVLRQYAVDNNLAISKQVIDQTILSTPEFQTNGSFDRDRFESVIRNVGMTPLTFRDYLRNEMLLGQDRTGFVSSSFALPNEVTQLTALDRQTRDIYLAELPLGDLSSVTVTDDEVQNYYASHQGKYETTEKLSLKYVQLSKHEIAAGVTVTETDLNSAYQQYIANFEASEAREASHILISIDESRSDEEAATLIQEIEDKISSGEDFSALAKEYSDDPGSAADGGDLGIVEKGVMVPEFEEALFALEEGQVSDAVKTDFGYHLIKLRKIDLQEIPTLASMRQQLENEQKSQVAEAEFVKLSEELDDLRFSSSDLQEASEIMELPIQTTGFFDRDGGDDPVTQHPRVLQIAFSDEVLKQGENSELIELDADRIIVINVNDHQSVRTQSVDEVKEQIILDIATSKLKLQRFEEGKQLAKGIDSASALSGNEPWQIVSKVTRTDPRVTPEVLTKLFRLAAPEEGKATTVVVEQGDTGVAVIALTAITENVETVTDEQLKNLTAFMASHKGQLEYQSRVAQLQADAEIDLN